MGTNWISPNKFAGFLGDRVGYKSGLALTRDEIIQHMDPTDPLINIMSEYSDQPARLRSDHIEDTFQIVLYRLGTIARPFVGHAPTILGLEFRDDENRRRLLNDILQDLESLHYSNGRYFLGRDFNEEAFFQLILKRYSGSGLKIAKRLISLTRESEEASPWSWFECRQMDWCNEVELKALFDSESLETPHGLFIDQRFIDYLERNHPRLDEMNWRKFEGLTAEYFSRNGFEVEVGPGRDDGGVDVRVWNLGQKDQYPPVTLIQCKRQKHKIDKVIVKSLWADVVDENANSGLIVTTSSLSPGADKVRRARSYPIDCANRANVTSWLSELRTPGTGVFLGS
ncbi:restriction endonuclease [Pseudomonas kilonensis]|uniref:restriction endonuclease n=1 Tax=Pseudomonas kilonensis TaxID=132476 RepID=UPI00209FAAC6|nr:restriction endonuclease [Pseudomonas kilonensis]MCP1455248.1 restriction system protein [Pseudomonas kilonensis]